MTFKRILASDEALGVELPAYVREELIATLQGEW